MPRERFERTDVPRPNPYRTYIALGVIVVVAIVIAISVTTLWDMAKKASSLGDKDIQQALASQPATAKTASDTLLTNVNTAAQSSGAPQVVANTDTVNLYLILQASGDAKPELISAKVYALNVTQSTLTIATLPTNMPIVVGNTTDTLAQVFASKGYAACVVPVAQATGCKISHVVLTQNDLIEMLSELRGLKNSELLKKARPMISQLKTDLNAGDMLNLVKSYRGISTESIQQYDAQLGEDGQLNTRDFGLHIGVLVEQAASE